MTRALTQNRYRGNRAPAERSKIKAQVTVRESGDGVAVIRLYDAIDSWGGWWGISAKEVLDALATLDSSVTDIHLHINSPGGEVFEAIAIKNILANHPAKVTAIVDGLAASAASFIAVAADELIMADNSELMIHDAWGCGCGNAEDFREFAELLDHISDNIAGIYAKKAGGDVADWRAIMIEERWYSDVEAVEAGLADRTGAVGDAGEIVPVGDDEEDDPFDPFDAVRPGFKYGSRDEAPAHDKAPEDDPADELEARRQRVELRQRRSAIAARQRTK